MKFYFCNGCGKRITEKDVTRGDARDKKLKGVFCTECAIGITTTENVPLTEAAAKRLLGKATPADGRSAAPAASSFYFCEKCGTRLTEEDIKHGQAMDKKLKGVFCVGCAEGVLTMEFEGLTSEEAKRLVARDREAGPAGSGRSAGRRSTRTRIPPAGQQDVRGSRASGRGHPEKPGRSSPLPILVGIGAAMLVVVVAALLFSGGGTPKAKQTSKSDRKKRDDKSDRRDAKRQAPEAPEPMAPETREAAPPVSPPKAASSTTEETVRPVPEETQPAVEKASPVASVDPEPPNPPPSPPVKVPVPVPEPVAHWKLDEGRRNEITDASGNDTKGKLRGMTDQNWIAPAPKAHGSKSALQFNGPRQWFHVRAHDKLKPVDVTIVAWIRLDAVSPDYQMIFERDRFKSHWSLLILNRGDRRVRFKWCKSESLQAASSLKLGVWHHVAATYERASQKMCIYMDGVLDATGSHSATSVERPLPMRFGASLHNKEYFKGALDDIRMYDRALTPSQVRTLMVCRPGPDGTYADATGKPSVAIPLERPLTKEEKEEQRHDRVFDALLDGVVSRLRDPKTPLAKVLEESNIPDGGEPFAAEARKMLSGVVAKLSEMRAERERALKAWAGKRVLLPSVGRTPVEIIEISDDGIKLKKFFRMNNQERSRIDSIPLDKLSPQDWKRLYTPTKPADPIGLAAELLRQLSEGIVDSAQQSLANIKGHELEPHLARAVERIRKAALEAKAIEVLPQIEKQCKQKRWKPLLTSLEDFEKTYGSTQVAKERRPDLDKWLTTAKAEVERAEGLYFDFKTPENRAKFLKVFKDATYMKFESEVRESGLVFRRTKKWHFNDEHRKQEKNGACLLAPALKVGTRWEVEFKWHSLITREVEEKDIFKNQLLQICFMKEGQKLSFKPGQHLRFGLSLDTQYRGRFRMGLFEGSTGQAAGEQDGQSSRLEWEVVKLSSLIDDDGKRMTVPLREDGLCHVRLTMAGNVLQVSLNGKQYDPKALAPDAVKRISESCLGIRFFDGRSPAGGKAIGEETVLEFFRFRAMD